MSAEGTVSFENARCVAQTPKAILVKLEDRERLEWIPQSVIHDDSEVYKCEQVGELVVLEWWAIAHALV